MTFRDFLHLLTTSRYTRRIEAENDELRRQVKELKVENAQLAQALLKRRMAEPSEADADALPDPSMKPLRPRRWVGFSQRKRELESREAPPKRSVSV